AIIGPILSRSLSVGRTMARRSMESGYWLATGFAGCDPQGAPSPGTPNTTLRARRNTVTFGIILLTLLHFPLQLCDYRESPRFLPRQPHQPTEGSRGRPCRKMDCAGRTPL